MNPKKVDMPTMSIDKYKDMKEMNKKFLTIREESSSTVWAMRISGKWQKKPVRSIRSTGRS